MTKGITPKPIDVSKIRKDLMKTSKRHGVNVAKQYGKITRAWKGDKPTLPVETEVKGGDLITSVIAGGGFGAQKMVWLDDGTKAHPITPKKGPFLVFQTGYKPVTKPRVIGSSGGGSFGPFVRAKEIKKHPGTKAREFSLTIANQEQPGYAADMQKAATP